jgi:hypothetical protein
MRMFWLAIAAAALWLTGCATAPEYRPPAGVITQGDTTTITIKTPCPHLVETYSADDQRRAADELDAAPADSILARMAIEDIALRDQIRICNGSASTAAAPQQSEKSP